MCLSVYSFFQTFVLVGRFSSLTKVQARCCYYSSLSWKNIWNVGQPETTVSLLKTRVWNSRVHSDTEWSVHDKEQDHQHRESRSVNISTIVPEKSSRVSLKLVFHVHQQNKGKSTTKTCRSWTSFTLCLWPTSIITIVIIIITPIIIYI